MTQKTLAAEPYEFTFDPASTALLIIDMQRDFVEPGGFGEALGNDVTPLQAVIAPCKRVLDAARRTGMLVIHTREGHGPDLADCPPTKIERGRGAKRIGDPGPMGRILVRGEHGHEHPRHHRGVHHPEGRGRPRGRVCHAALHVHRQPLQGPVHQAA